MSDEPPMVGRRIRRREDGRFVKGEGRFTDDLAPAGLLHGVAVRSTRAHVRNLRIDVDEAAGMPGVRLILTAHMLAEVGLDCVPVDLPPPGHTFEDWTAPAQPILARDEARFVGDILAFVVADTLEQGRDAAEALIVEGEDGTAIVDMRQAAPIFDYEEGDAGDVDRAFAGAAQVLEATIWNNRVDAAPIETRCCIGSHEDGRFTLHVSTQRVQIIHRALADRVFRVARDRVRVVAPDVGGGFGQKNGLYPEYVLCLEAARRLGRPVKWTPDRGEALSSDCHGRDNLFSIEAALDAEDRVTAIRATRLMNMGAYASSRAMVPVANGLTHLTGVYAIQAAHVTVKGVLTNTAPTCPYRGAGRPENVFCCERLVDIVARKLGRDPIDFRRLNLVRRDAMPWTTPLGTVFDTHDFQGLLDRALAMVDHGGFPARREASKATGGLRGLGVCLFAEDLHGSAEPIPARLNLQDDKLVVIVGTGSAGHGHETSFLQVAADALGLPMDRLDFQQSDTALMPEGVGTAASWSLTLGGSSVRLAAEAATKQARAIAADLLETSPRDVAFERGLFRVVGADLAVSWDDVFRAAPGFTAHGCFEGHGRTVPAGCHACEVEVDPETGAIAVLGYAVAQDSGMVVNPLLFEGQLHGGVAQGVGQGWCEEMRYDAEGQLLSGGFTDYALLRAGDLPHIMSHSGGAAARDNPMGVKGVGEAAATGSTPAFVNAVMDALWPLGIVHLDPPLTPNKVWSAILEANTASVMGIG